jgi:predicted transcriptional regulator
VLSAAGKKAAHPDVDRDPIEFWKQKLPGAQSKLLGLILEHPAISKEDLAIKAGVSHTTGSYQQNLRDMRTYGIIEIESGQVAPSELLFPRAYA